MVEKSTDTRHLHWEEFFDTSRGYGFRTNNDTTHGMKSYSF
jgi:hypothetical protein